MAAGQLINAKLDIVGNDITTPLVNEFKSGFDKVFDTDKVVMCLTTLNKDINAEQSKTCVNLPAHIVSAIL